jgi:hypothetical protein
LDLSTWRHSVIACVLAWAGSATLATTPTARAAQISVSEGALLFVAQPGEHNVLQVDQHAFGFDVFEDGAPLTPGPGCHLEGRRHATCGAVLVLSVGVQLGDRNDDANISDVTLPYDVSAGEGDDLVQGGAGSGSVQGGAGRDVILGGAGADRLTGGADDDLLQGSRGADLLNGESGTDVLQGEDASDILLGGSGPDLLQGAGGDDELDGDDGDDAIIGGQGEDNVSGGSGDDTAFTGDDQVDDVDCGVGTDSVNGDATDRSSGCTNAPDIAPPDVWPPNERSARRSLPPPTPRIHVTPRRRGAATWIRVTIHDSYYETYVKLRLTDKHRKHHWKSGCIKVHTGSDPVHDPKPPHWAYRGKGRYC